jgi:hypothetical protein
MLNISVRARFALENIKIQNEKESETNRGILRRKCVSFFDFVCMFASMQISKLLLIARCTKMTEKATETL